MSDPSTLNPPPVELGLSILESLGIGMAILTSASIVRYLNGPAREFLADTQCFFVHRDGRLIPSQHQSRFSQLLNQLGTPAAEPYPVEQIFLSGSQGHRYSILIKAQRVSDTAEILLFFPKKTKKNPISFSLLSDWYGITRAEARLLAWLSTSKSVTEAAQLCHITPGTARIHLKHILQKTGFHRQTDLLIDLLSNPLLPMIAETRQTATTL